MSDGLFCSGIIKIAVPEGWLAFCGINSEGRVTPKTVHVCKDAAAETDLFTHVSVTICFFGREDIWLSPKSFYDDIVDREPVTLGAYTWNGYTCTSFGYPYTMLVAEKDGCVFQVMILMKNGDYEISPEDTDIQTILSSLTITN